MRPAVPDILPSPPPKSSCPEQTGPPWTDNQGAGPTTFFLARERNDDGVSPRECSSSRESMYGVQSLEETISRADSPGSLPDVPSAAGPGLVDQDDLAWSTRRRSTLKPSDLLYRKDDKVDLSACSSQSRISCSVDRSRPLTPLGIGVADELSSLPSSPKSTSTRSLKPMDDVSITDEINSPAIASGGEDEESAEHSERLFDSSSQLIMPSIRMPSRRPFTERGKNLGRFKILVAGANGKCSSTAQDVTHQSARFRKIIPDQGHRAELRGDRSCGSHWTAIRHGDSAISIQPRSNGLLEQGNLVRNLCQYETIPSMVVRSGGFACSPTTEEHR